MNSKEQWQNYFCKLKRQVNSGWFLQNFEPLFLMGLIVLTIINIYVRTYQPKILEYIPYFLECAILFTLIISSAIAFARAHKKFFSEEELLIRYDERYQYNCQLIKAYQGEQAWPPLPDHMPGNFVLEWKRNSSFFLFSIFLICAFYWVPIQSELASVKIEKPIAWIETEECLEKMEEDKSIDSKQVEEFKKKLEQLQQQDKKDWFSHSNLEASNSLLDTLNSAHKSHEATMDKVSQMLQQMGALQELTKEMEAGNIDLSDEMQQKLRKRLDEMEDNWQKNMSQLASQLLKMRPDLMEELKKIKPEDYVMSNGEIDQKVLDECLKRLEEKGQCKKCGGEGCKPGDENSEGNCKNGSCNAGLLVLEGAPALERGGGPGGDLFRERESEKHDTEIESVQGEKKGVDGSSLLGTSDAQHNLEKNKYKSNQLSESSSNLGAGGEAVWKENLLPEEQKILRSIKQ